MIDVRLYGNYAAASSQGMREFQVEARPGLTVDDVVRDAGVPAADSYVVMINGYGARLDAEINDGDRVVLFPAIFGG
ncbi:MAG: MoaD/ThiS family protein [bacterium]